MRAGNSLCAELDEPPKLSGMQWAQADYCTNMSHMGARAKCCLMGRELGRSQGCQQGQSSAARLASIRAILASDIQPTIDQRPKCLLPLPRQGYVGIVLSVQTKCIQTGCQVSDSRSPRRRKWDFAGRPPHAEISTDLDARRKGDREAMIWACYQGSFKERISILSLRRVLPCGQHT